MYFNTLLRSVKTNTRNFKHILTYRQIKFVCVIVIVLLISLLLMTLNIYELHRVTEEHWKKEHNLQAFIPEKIDKALDNAGINYPSAWVRSKNKKTSHLMHVISAFKAFNYEIKIFDDEEASKNEWNILWSHNYPFRELKSYLLGLKSTHCINHFPGTGFITNKVDLATSNIPSVPKAFRMPIEKVNLTKFAKENPDIMFVQKSNEHRGIKIDKFKDLNLDNQESFIQQFVHNPLLVDGYKFDIGVYTILTSVNPLRVYTHEDILFRFCTEKYEPFSANISEKYVVGDSYLPIWEIPSLHHYYKEQGFGMRGTFDAYLRSKNRNPEVIWNQVQESIRSVFYSKEKHIIEYLKPFPSNLLFFEVMRFDFIVDENLKVFLMEANMSPNLSSSHFKENRLLYEQVAHNLLSLIGLSYSVCSSISSEEEEMRAAFKDIAVFPQYCSTNCADQYKDCWKVDCQLCKPCLLQKQVKTLRKAYLEHTWRGSYRRVIPQSLNPEKANLPIENVQLSPQNTLMSEWFRGKCLLDTTFCS